MSYTPYARAHGGEQLVTAVAGAVLTLLLVLLVASGWLIIQGLNLLLTAFAHQPKHPALWIPLLSSLGLWTATGFVLVSASSSMSGQTHPHLPLFASILAALALVATVALFVSARVLEILRSDLLLVDQGMTTLVDKVLRQPWWQVSE